jgi:hypothetical protein
MKRVYKTIAPNPQRASIKSTKRVLASFSDGAAHPPCRWMEITMRWGRVWAIPWYLSLLSSYRNGRDGDTHHHQVPHRKLTTPGGLFSMPA